MKNIKKLLSIVMMLALVLSLGASAFAAEVTLPDQAKDHTMVAYQIFEGAQAAPGDAESGKLGVTGWGSAITDSTAFLNYLIGEGYTGFNAGMTAMEAADVIRGLASPNDASANVALGNAIADAVRAQQGGVSKTFTDGKADLGTGYWVIVDDTQNLPNGETRSTVLLEVVGTDLTLQDKIDQPTVEKKADGADAEVKGLGETVNFTLTTTLPKNYDDFAEYYLAFHDTMDAGLDFGRISSVSCGAATADVKTEVAAGYELVQEPTDGCTFEVKLANVKEIFPDAQAGDTITVTYTATVNENAVVINKNNVKLEYSENPAKTDEYGTTPPETVVVFTFQLHGTKVDGTGEPLDGAKFTLYMKDESGDYEYNGEKYKVYRTEIEAELQEDGSYAFAFDQLGKGEYLLVESTVPAGYNKAPDVYFQVVDTYDENRNVTGAEVRDENNELITGVEIEFAEGGTVQGIYDKEVVNQSGLELPETGGIGTTIFYVVGAILVVGAVILLVTRKRVSGAEK